MAQATFWFASPFTQWIGRRALALSWDGQGSLRRIVHRLAADSPRRRANLPHEGLQDETMNRMLAVIFDGEFLSLNSIIPDGAKADVLTPLAGGAAPVQCVRRPVAIVTPAKARVQAMITGHSKET